MKIAVLPRDANPYQECVYDEMRRAGHSMRYVGELTNSQTVGVALLPFELLVARATGHRVLHVHWLYRFKLPVVGGHRLAQMMCRLWFVLILRVARLAGLRVVWIAHNVLPHDQIFDDDVAARRSLIMNASAVVAHAETTLAELSAFATLPAQTFVIRHPAYRLPCLPLDIDNAPLRLAYFGTVSDYKGVPDLLAAVRAVEQPVELTIAGECRDSHVRREIESAHSDERITVRLGRLSDDDLLALLTACDVVVLPFRHVTTSGSALFALSAGRGLVLPDLAAFDHLPKLAVRRFAGTTDRVESLTRTLNGLAQHKAAAADMGNAGFAWAHEVTWSDLSRVLTAASTGEPA